MEFGMIDDEGVRLLRGLVAIPSLSGQEGDASAFLADWMAGHGFRAFVDDAGNAVGVLEPEDVTANDGGVREIVLLGHIDTVNGRPPVRIVDGKLYGRGSVDAKGPLAAFATAAALVGPRPGWRIVVIGAVEEESTTSKGALYALGQYSPAMLVIGEPSGWQRLTLGYKGRLLADLTVRQAMAHRSGQNSSACEVAVAFWNQLAAEIGEMNAGRQRAWDQVLAALRGFHSGDDGLYEVATLHFGFRLPLDVSPEQLQAVMLRLAGGASLSFHGPEVAYQADKGTELVRMFLRAVRSQGGHPSFVLKTGTSDMNVVGPVWKCPLLAYGPGDSNLDHTPQEHVDLDEWQRGVAVLRAVLNSLPD
jgi:[amino group carrier protein]-lysine/ornithine hydrolase